MFKKWTLCLLLGMLCLGASAADTETPSDYNRGVDAFRNQDYALARDYWAKAAQAHDSSALNNLGYLLFYGLGGSADTVHAVQLWQEAAVAGHSEAQWHLGHALERGQGVALDKLTAYAWYRCAVVNAQSADAGHGSEAEIAKDARTSLAKLLDTLPIDQLAAAEQQARQYIALYAKSAGRSP